MKLATFASPASRDGELIVVSKDNQRAIRVPQIASSLRQAVESWSTASPKLEQIYQQLNQGSLQGELALNAETLPHLHSPLPRSFQWADGSAFIQHVKLVRMARNAPMPDGLETVPLMYQGGSDCFLRPTQDIPQIDFSHGTDFEGEVGVIVDDTPMGISAEAALSKIILFVVINDVSLRGLIPEELAVGFGFFQSKPSSAFAPFAVTAEELGGAWLEGRVHLPLNVEYNGERFGQANAGEMHFHFGQLIAHAARTRDLGAGTIIGSGTVANDDLSRGSSCLAEKRMLEKIHEGVIKTPFMKVGDSVKIEMLDREGRNVFGTIQQKVVKA
jgi:fumarylacetoacetate (FAA) hydrolase